MQIRCPQCHHLGITHPEALLGRIYICCHCHWMLHLAPHGPGAFSWHSLTTEEIGTRPLRGGRENGENKNV